MSALRHFSFPAPDQAISFKRRPPETSQNQEQKLHAMVADKFIKAQPRHIEGSDSSRTAVQAWGKMCDHRDSGNSTFVTTRRLAAACKVSIRTMRRAIEELREEGWICLPNGDRGGRPRKETADSKPAITFHLHPFGKGCNLPAAPLTQRRKRPDIVEANRARWEATRKVANEPGNPAILSSFPKPKRMTPLHEKDDKGDIAYKDEPLLTPNKERAALLLDRCDENFAGFYVEYTSRTGVAVNEIDLEKAAREWRFLSLEDQIAAKSFIPQLIDGRPPNRYQLPKNYLADRPWARVSIRKEPAPVRGLTPEEILR